MARHSADDAGNDRSPEGQVGFAEELIVGEVGSDEQLNGTGATRGKIASHLNGKEAVVLTVDDEDRDAAVSGALDVCPLDTSLRWYGRE